MSTPLESSAAFFEAKYQKMCDPWNFAGSHYELRRYDAILAALSPRRYRRAFEPGCSVGVLTEKLSFLCEEIEAIDLSPTAVACARKRCAHLGNVTVACKSLTPSASFAGFDLIVLSEIGYYFAPDEWNELTANLIRTLASGATLLAVHWLGNSTDHRMSGDQVHLILGSSELLEYERSEWHEAFRLDRWVRL